MKKHILFSLIYIFCFISSLHAQQKRVSFCGSDKNDLYRLMEKEGFELVGYNTPEEAITNATEGTGVIIVSDSYPEAGYGISQGLYEKAIEKRLRLYVEYPSSFPGLDISGKIFKAMFERGVVTSNVFRPLLQPMSLLGVNDCHVLEVNVKDPLIVLAKVAGFNKAEYGIRDVKTYPLLFRQGSALIAMTGLSDFRTGRYGPHAAWKKVWEYILSYITGIRDLQIGSWPLDVRPLYAKNAPLPSGAKKEEVARGAQWFFNGRFFIDSSWNNWWIKWADAWQAIGPAVPAAYPNGDGSLGVLEGHYAKINYDGSQPYRHWVRDDVQGEVAFAMASAGKLLDKPAYYRIAGNISDFIFHSNLCSGPRADKDSASFGFIGWLLNYPKIFYGDDNACSILGVIGASAYLKTSRWDKYIIENILANFRTSSKQGFQGDYILQDDLQRLGWKHFGDRDLINPHPHFESWLWACYLWLYDKTKYKPLLDKAETAIRLTMEAYPDKWKWTNGIAQERARMILPLAWLVRVDDTREHREWLNKIVSRLLENQVECGAIQEELGQGKSLWGHVASNKAYGTQESSLIFANGDPVADMLYTNNFAFFALNEAAAATGNKKYKAAVNKLSDFLTRIQVRSDKHTDLDGAWFRAFDYDTWEYWASNADQGWGAWPTQTGWTQSWIIATQVLIELHKSYWEITKRSFIKKQMPEMVKLMLGNEK